MSAHTGTFNETFNETDYKSNDLEGYGAQSPDVSGFKHQSIRNKSVAENRMSAFGGAIQLSPYKPTFRKFANPAPLGLCAFALTSFVLSLVNANARHTQVSNVAVGLAYAYGGLIQLLAGMWEMAAGNTFGATCFSSYGGFWLSFAMIETGGFGISSAYDGHNDQFLSTLGFYLIAWFIFTTMLLFCTLKSSIANFSVFLFLDITYLLLAVAHLNPVDGGVNLPVQKAAGIFGLITAFIAWYAALAAIAESSNSFFLLPVGDLPWSDKVQAERRAAERRASRIG